MSDTNSSIKLRVAGYCRTSGEGQRDNTSIPGQEDAIEAFCGQNEWSFVRHYVDECRSGGKTEGREDYQRMMKDAANGEFDIVVVYDITRFGRDGVDIVGGAKFLKTTFDIHTIDTLGRFDNRHHSNALHNYVQAGLAEDERLRIMERTISGRIRRAEEGKPWCAPQAYPVGRYYDKEKKLWYITDKGKAIRKTLRRYVAGESLTDLCREYGFPTAKISEWVWHGQLAGTYKAKFRSPEIDIDLGVPVVAIPEVLSQSLLDKARKRLQHNRTFNRHDAKKYHLSGFIRCRDCGRALTGQTRKGKVYYRHAGQDGCSLKSARGDEVEPAVLDYLYSFFLDQPAFDEAVKRVMPSPKDRKRMEKERADTEKRLNRNQHQIDRLVDAVASGADVDLLTSKQARLKTEKEALERRLEELSAEIATMPSAEESRAAALLTRLALIDRHRCKDWRRLEYDDIKRLLHHLFGETTKGRGTGIFVHKNELGNLDVTFKGQVDFYHLMICNGQPVTEDTIRKAMRLNPELERMYDKALAELRPSTANK